MSSAGPQESRPKARWADLVPRLLSAAVIVAIAVIALYFGGWVYAIVMAVVFALLYREWDQMVTLKPLEGLGWAVLVACGVAPLAYPLWGYPGTLVVMAVAVVIAIFGGRAFLAWRAGGLVFFAIVMVAVMTMRGETPLGNFAGWYLGLVVAFNDSGAFFTGRFVGGPKLAPTISPAKTWAGAIGGLITGTVAGTIFWALFVPSPLWIGIGFAVVLGLVGQAGDLSESAIKRIFRIKDSGDVIPGHGGFMDRLDSISFGALFIFLVGALHGGIGDVAGGFLRW